MSKVWPRFTKEHPCPSCGHSDWTCRAGDKKYICMRVESDRAAHDGGWYHEYGDAPRPYIPPARTPQRPTKDIASVWNGLPEVFSFPLAEKLGVSEGSLLNIQARRKGDAWAIPMRDGDNSIVGIHLRCDNGDKRAVPGSRNGLFIPQVSTQKVCYLPEGMSNTAALLTMGVFAIGRPSCNSGTEQLKVALKRLGVHRVVIVADADEIKFGGKRPGYAGAMKLQKELKVLSVIFVPPSPLKDVRDMLKKCGAESARRMIESSIEQKVWVRV